jgi:hypothetical protein
MATKALLCFMLLFLISGCNEEVPKEQYNAGWEKAAKDACDCNENLVQIDHSEAAKAGFGWADGYIKGCVHFKKENKCK